jgi:SAM-dependent methyltransferase
MRSLTELANESKTDKGTTWGDRHGYTLVYEMLFSPYRASKINLLEIGLQTRPEADHSAEKSGSDIPSVKIWQEYLLQAHIYGVDISDFSAFAGERFTFIQADCGSPEQLDGIAKHGVFDIVIDDGSHASFHQQTTILNLFGALKPGGLYIIEDLHWQPSYERDLPRVNPTTEVLKTLCVGGPLDPIRDKIAGLLLVDEFTLDLNTNLFNRANGLPPKTYTGRLGGLTKMFRPSPVKLAVIKKRL